MLGFHTCIIFMICGRHMLLFQLLRIRGNVSMFMKLIEQNLKFTHEVGPKHIAFLKTEIHLPFDYNTSKVYRKRTNTNVILNYMGFIHKVDWLIVFFTVLLFLAKKVLIQDEIFKVRQIFPENGSAKKIFVDCVKRFLYRKFERREDNQDKDNDT